MVDVLNDRSHGALGLLLSRRSGSAKAMTAPGPNADELRSILTAAMRAPDHGKLFPWRFVIFEGEGRERIGEFFAECLRTDEPAAGEVRIEIEEMRFMRAPVVVAVVSRVAPDIKIPEWEQQLSAGAVCENMLIAAHALGYVASWITEWCAYDGRVAKEMGLGEHERIAGFIYLGSPAAPLEERVRPEFDAVVSRY